MVDAPVTIGRYRVLGLVGQGAMGVVYKAVDEGLDREVAIKVMSAAHADDPESHARFLREARAAGRLQHPNIITIYEMGEHQGAPFMAMEYLVGVDLQQAIRAGLRPDPRQNLPIVLDVLAGLAQAHEHGIVHRDIKPSNVFLPRGRPAKIMDFGVARLGQGMTTAGATVGTPNYMSPEQVRGGALDGRSDLFSTGLILYELVTGEKAYQGTSIVNVMFQIAQGPPDLSLLPRGPQWETLRHVLDRALAHEPDARYADAREMHADLQAALDDLGGARTGGADRATFGPTSRQEVLAPAIDDLGSEPSSPEPEAADEPAPPVEPPAPARVRRPAPRPRRNGPVLIAAVLGLATLGLALYGLKLALGPTAPPVPTGTPSPAESPVVQFPTAPTLAPATMGSVPVVHPTPIPTPLPSAAPITLSGVPAPATAPEGPAQFFAPSPRASPRAAAAEAGGDVERASDLLERGRYGAAMAEARAVLRRDPGNAQARAVLEDAEAAAAVESQLQQARDFIKRGDRAAALEHVKAGLAVAPSDSRLLALFRQLQ